MGLAFLRLPHAQTKWRLKLLSAYRDKNESTDDTHAESDEIPAHRHSRPHTNRRGGGKMILFGLPLITVLREGLEGVVFLGGIGLSESPPAVAGGALAGAIVGGTIGQLSLAHRRFLANK
jgi:high-affinity iron transporter